MASIKGTLKTAYPELVSQLDEKKNRELNIDAANLNMGSRTKVWWICDNGHSYDMTISHKAKSPQCPICSGRRIVQGINDFETLCRHQRKEYLLEEWDYEKNEKTPCDYGAGSTKSVYWICKECGFHFQKDIKSKFKGFRCTNCTGRPFSRRAPLKEEHPELVKELDYEKNCSLGIDAENTSCGSSKKIWWKCNNGHSYDMAITNKLKMLSICPICDRKRVVPGHSDLETICKKNGEMDILLDWDYEKNILLPSAYSYKDNRVVSWKCHRCEKRWDTRINVRTHQKSGCPACKKEMRTSFPEQALFYYVKKLFPDAENGNVTAVGMELDIYIPSKKVAIEYDGKVWHASERTKKLEEKKNSLCKNNGITLIRVRESGLGEVSDCVSFVRENASSNNSLSEVIKQVLLYVGVDDANVDCNRDEIDINNEFITLKKKSSLAVMHPELAREWLQEKNGTLTPELVSSHSHKVVWWKCSKCGNEWRADIHNRTGKLNAGCPMCRIETNKLKQSAEVRNIDTGLAFQNAEEASNYYNISRSAIMACCRGVHQTAGGFHWEYTEKKPKRRKPEKMMKKIINLDTGVIYASVTEAEQTLHMKKFIGKVADMYKDE